MRSGRFPKDLGSLVEIAEFRSLAWRVMWTLNIFILAVNGIQVAIRWTGNEQEAIGMMIAAMMVWVLLNSLVFLALILTPIGGPVTEPVQESVKRELSPRFRRRFNQATFHLGLVSWLLLIFMTVVIVAGSLKPREPRDLAWEARQAADNRMEAVQEEFIRKNCRSMNRGEYDKHREALAAEELEKLRAEEKPNVAQ